jgi:hypothetical protein
MKHCLVIFLVLFPIMLFSQTKDTTFIITKHSNGKIATKKVKLTNDIIRGYAKAFDQTGKEIYNFNIRNFAGHASVDFYFYSSGAVERAQYSSHPDGGIQWSDITHFFHKDGKLNKIEDNSSDEYGRFRLQIDPSYTEDSVSINKQPVILIEPEKNMKLLVAQRSIKPNCT